MYGCPNCGGGLKFDIATQQLRCDYCESLFDPYSVMRGKDADESTDNYGVTIFTCPQCGGEIITTDESITGFCTFCGASTVLDSRMASLKRPEKIITFKKTKEDCKEIYRRMAKRAIFAPKQLKDPEYLEKFRGIYIPYWVYDISYDEKLNFAGTTSQQLGSYIETSHYDLSFDLDAEYTGVSYDASASFDDHISESIAPFMTANMQDFTPSFLCGFYADTADVDKELYKDDAINAAENDVVENISLNNNFTPYRYSDMHQYLKGRARVNSAANDPEMGLFPVWFLSYRTKNNRMAYAVVNAESGEISADLPVDIKKYLFSSCLIAAAIFVVLNLFLTMTPFAAVVSSIVFSIISLVVYAKEITEIKQRHMRYDDKGFYAKYGSATDDLEMKKVSPARGAIGSIIALIICVAVAVVRPVEDIYYYIAAIAAIVGVCITMSAIMRRFNLLSTRPFPEFLGRKGGDDSAKDR